MKQRPTVLAMLRTLVGCVLLIAQARVLAYGQSGADRPPKGAATSNRVVVVRAGRLFDGKSDKLSNDQVVVVQGSRITNVGPVSRNQPRFVGMCQNFTLPLRVPGAAALFGKTSAVTSTSRVTTSARSSFTRMFTRSTRARLRTISAYTHGITANFPGQSVRLCGHAIHVDSCGSHSPGMR